MQEEILHNLGISRRQNLKGSSLVSLKRKTPHRLFVWTPKFYIKDIENRYLSLSLKDYLADSNGIISAFVNAQRLHTAPTTEYLFVPLLYTQKFRLSTKIKEKRGKKYALRFLCVFG